MPKTTPAIKVEAVGELGAGVVLSGDNYTEAKRHCDELVASTGRTFVHPFDDELVIAGQGTVGHEILRHKLGEVDAIFVPVGGGGLIAGIASYVKALRPAVEVIGVEPYEADAMYQSLAVGRRVVLDRVGIFADGVAVQEVGRLTFPIVQSTVREVVRVSNDEICAAIKDIFDDTRSIMEPAGALAVAGLRAWVERTGTTERAAGGDPERREHELRSAALRRRARRAGRVARGAVRRHDSGAARRVPRVLRHDRPAGRDRVQLPAERPRPRPHLRRHRHPLEAGRRRAGRHRSTPAAIRRVNLTDNELAKLHVRHMVGGRMRTRCRTSGSTGSSSRSGPAR